MLKRIKEFKEESADGCASISDVLRNWEEHLIERERTLELLVRAAHFYFHAMNNYTQDPVIRMERVDQQHEFEQEFTLEMRKKIIAGE